MNQCEDNNTEPACFNEPDISGTNPDTNHDESIPTDYDGYNDNGRRDVLPADVPLDCMETIAASYGIDIDSQNGISGNSHYIYQSVDSPFIVSTDATMIPATDPQSGSSITARHVIPTPMGFEEDGEMSSTKWRDALDDYMPELAASIEDSSRSLIVRAIKSMGDEGRGGTDGFYALLNEKDEKSAAALDMLTDGMTERLCGFLTMEIAKIADTRIRAWYAGNPDESAAWWNGGDGDEKMAGTMLENQIATIYYRYLGERNDDGEDLAQSDEPND